MVPDTLNEFGKRKYENYWKTNYFSNYEYISVINKFSGRTYNDLSQYPIYPWVINTFEEGPPKVQSPIRPKQPQHAT